MLGFRTYALADLVIRCNIVIVKVVLYIQWPSEWFLKLYTLFILLCAVLSAYAGHLLVLAVVTSCKYNFYSYTQNPIPVHVHKYISDAMASLHNTHTYACGILGLLSTSGYPFDIILGCISLKHIHLSVFWPTETCIRLPQVAGPQAIWPRQVYISLFN